MIRYLYTFAESMLKACNKFYSGVLPTFEVRGPVQFGLANNVLLENDYIISIQKYISELRPNV